ncbi:alanine--tRNA ligase [Desulfonema ishimotonii]|uniref:Alanine--tRNA ligase n=1 Tax=Desulfonema ishimotonii TaxID=45657 RepID=A0A401G0C0_9BACT|nr:alanine--tRNA ligase [Desulfonema ishimotonii]GBC62636.1 alanine--tRNA ligase [Desulfonema ishimotonii]
MTGNEVRKKFLEYFKKHNHQVVRSSSLVPQDDPTLLFTNAGMVQFKRTFLGEEKRDYVRAVTSQKCVRAGGKHNDLENVGYTARHHTFFEMLGNFSFGDYFKEKAIAFAWDLLTNGYGLPADQLWISIYLDDDEAFRIWREDIGIPEERIVRLGEKDNFWAMGDTGPCGPCSEIHIDRGPEFACGPDCKLGCDCDRYLEIWNLVFMQYNRDASGKMTPLPHPSIDTGMGLERVASVLQNVPTNYDTDLIMPIMRKAEGLAGKKMSDSAETEVAIKVIADHSRAMAFLIGDGVLPSNEGRGYVLRRIMRRAIRYGRHIGLTRPFLHETAGVVFDIMKPAYPELSESRAFITNVIRNEELRFSETLDKGLTLLNETLAGMAAQGRTEVPGDVMFRLYDTYGFPADIVQDVVRDREITLDMKGFDARMAEQRKKSRSVVSFTGIGEAYKTLSASGVKPEFTGYTALSAEASVLLVVQAGKAADAPETGSEIEVVTDKTPFYAESGGQAGDVGRITAEGFEMVVSDTIKDPTGLIIHRGKIVSGTVKRGETVTLTVDSTARAAAARNHTATHILHAALRQILGDHVKQAGSLVAPGRLRFDFTHFSQIAPETLEEIEAVVNANIRQNVPVQIDEMDAETAFKSGAMALFEEKYGDRVRVISLSDFSKELCGGTHARMTGDIGLFKIVSESGVASGVRRIEALAGAGAVEYIRQTARTVRDAAALLKDRPDTLVARLEKHLADHRALEKEVEKLKARMATMTAASAGDEVREINGVKVLAKKVQADNPASLRDAADKFRDQIRSGVVVLGSAIGPKAMLIAVVSKDLAGRFHAGNIIKQTAAIVGGGGGGRPDMAQAGGSKPEKLDEALENVYQLIAGE